MPLAARLQPADLIAKPDAYFWYVASLRPEDARTWLDYAAERLTPEEWVDQCVGVAYFGGPEVQGVVADAAGRVADRIIARKSVEQSRALLSALLLTPALKSALAPVGAWLATHATAGDAEVVAEWLESRALPATSDVRLALELALLERGSTELRRRDRARVAASILMDMDRRRPDLRETALRVYLQNDFAREVPDSSSDPSRRPGLEGIDHLSLLAITERALERGSDASLARDVAVLIGWGVATGSAFGDPRLARVSEALVGAVVDDDGDVGTRWEVGWCLGEMLRTGRDLPRLRSARAIEEAIGVLSQHDRSFILPDEAEKLGRWARSAAESWFDLHGVCKGDTDGLSRIDRIMWRGLETLLESPSAHAPLFAVLRARLLSETSHELDAARAILEAHPDDVLAIVPAVRALPRRSIRLEAPTGAVSPDELTVELERLFLRRWSKPIGGVDVAGLLGDANRIELADLEGDRKFDIVNRALRIDRVELLKYVAGASGERALALAALYAAHELVHGAQGLADKDTVVALRAAGGESALLHVDLAADHAAAKIVHAARSAWSLEWLKDLLGVTGAKFPVGRYHVVAARARKLGRLLSLRLDYLVRREGLIPRSRLDESYAFLEHGPAGGTFVVLTSGPPMSVAGTTRLTAEDAELLGRAADLHPPTLEQVDGVLLRLARACASTERAVIVPPGEARRSGGSA